MTRVIKIAGFLALMCLTSFAYADPYCQVTVGAITTLCGTPPLTPIITAPRGNFDNPGTNGGFAPLDDINWGLNNPEGTCGTTPSQYCGNPEWYGLGYQGQGYNVGPNGTGYSLGQVGLYQNLPNANLSLYTTTNAFLNMPQTGDVGGGAYDNPILTSTGANPAVGGLALTWDTTDYGLTYPITYADPNCGIAGGVSGPGAFAPDGNVCVPAGGPSGATINGVGFDFQLGVPLYDTEGQSLDNTAPLCSDFPDVQGCYNPDAGNQTGVSSAGPWSVTFNIYSATPGCSGSASDTDNGGSTNMDCFDYSTGEMTDTGGGDLGPNTQLIATVTMTSSDGGALFFGVTSGSNIAAIVVTNVTSSNASENGNLTFGLDTVDLLTQTTPEPATLLLFGSGLLVAARRLRKGKGSVK